MHLGTLATIGAVSPPNLYHIVFNNSSHESVGGQSTTAPKSKFGPFAMALGYKEIFSVTSIEETAEVLSCCSGRKGPIFIEITLKNGVNGELRRPSVTPRENRDLILKLLHG